MELLKDILYILLWVAVGGVAGFFIAKSYLQKYLKKNPPINEQVIKTMMTSMGRTPSAKQVKQMMNQINKNM